MRIRLGVSSLREELSGLAVSADVRRRFLSRWGSEVVELARNKALSHGGCRLWPALARSTRLLSCDADSARIGCNHVAAAQKQYGGVIEARNRRCLTIPIHALSRGRRAAELEGYGLFVLRGGRSSGVLGYRDGGRFVGLYALVKRTRPQRAEPWWPTGAEVLSCGVRTGREVFWRG